MPTLLGLNLPRVDELSSGVATVVESSFSSLWVLCRIPILLGLNLPRVDELSSGVVTVVESSLSSLCVFARNPVLLGLSRSLLVVSSAGDSVRKSSSRTKLSMSDLFNGISFRLSLSEKLLTVTDSGCASGISST